MNFTLYLTHATLFSSTRAQALLSILKDLEYPEPSTVVGIPEVAKLTRGHFNPSSAAVLLAPDGSILYDAFDLIEWFNLRGLRPL